MIRNSLFTTLAVTSILLFSCKKEEYIIPERIEKISPQTLSRVLLNDEDSLISINTIDIGYSVTKTQKKEIKLNYKATITPPKIDGELVKATHIAIDSTKHIAYVSYNTEGATYLGALDIIDISDLKHPKIITSLKFNSTDISAIDFDSQNQKLYLATATEDLEFNSPSVLETIKLNASGDYVSSESRKSLSSYVSTSVKVIDEDIYTLTGNTGGLFKSTDNGKTNNLIHSIHDARWIDANEDYVFVLAGTPAKIYLFDKTSLSEVNTYSPGGANIPESKSHMISNSNYLYIAAGDEGCKVLDIETGNTVFQIENPDLQQLSADKEVCNTIATYGNYIFTGNGEAGVYVLENDGDPANSTVNGNLKFKKDRSVNHLLINAGYLFVARGLDGFIIAEIEEI